MKIILTPNDQAVAIQAYLMDTFNIVTYINEELLQDMQLDINPNYTADPSKNTEDTTVVEDDREWAETRAEELGINFRSDIKTSTLITRIEEAEEELAKQARNPDPLPMDEPDYEETQYEEVQEEVTEAEEAIEDEPEAEEKPVQSKKPSIFDKR